MDIAWLLLLRIIDYKCTNQLPKIVEKAYAINKKNGNTLCWDAIQKEMENVRSAFQTTLKVKKPPNGFQYINSHMMFGIIIEDFHRKANLVVGGHMTQKPDTITHSSVLQEKLYTLPLLWWCKIT